MKLGINFLVFTISSLFLFHMSARADRGAGVFQPNPKPCSELIDQLFRDDGWMEHLVNPEITSKAEESLLLQRYTDIHDCIEENPGLITKDISLLYTLTEYFMVFVGGYGTTPGDSSLLLVDMQTSDDPAIQQIRDLGEIAPPKGYVYVRFYNSRGAMPPLVNRVFENVNVAGVTMLARYIAILDETQLMWEEQALQSQTLPKTLSHELVHAYIKSLAGSAGFDVFPTWYDEGLAIYFSGSGEDTSIVTPNGQIVVTPTEDYKHYQTVFEYLEAELGREQLLKLIRRSVEAVDPSMLYRGAGFYDDNHLAERAQAWKNKQDALRIGTVVLLILLVGFGLLRITPEIKCQYCGFGGRKKDFIAGYCPQCRRLVKINLRAKE